MSLPVENPSEKFGDPFAAKTQWTPLVPGGANFITHRLIANGPTSFVVAPSTALMVFGLSLLLAGLIAGVVGLLYLQSFAFLAVFPLFAAGLFALWRKRLRFDGVARVFNGEKPVPFTSIHALQLLAEKIDGNEDPRFDSFELNLVLTTGERINLADHCGLVQLREEAQKLGALIGCKVWDASRG